MIKKLNSPFTTILITCQKLLIVSHLPESFDVPLGCLSEVCSERVIREYDNMILHTHRVLFRKCNTCMNKKAFQ